MNRIQGNIIVENYKDIFEKINIWKKWLIKRKEIRSIVKLQVETWLQILQTWEDSGQNCEYKNTAIGIWQ